MTCWCHPQFWGIRPSISNSSAYNFILTQQAQIMWKFWPEHCYANKHAKKDFRAAVVDNVDNKWTPPNIKWLFSRHKCVLSLAGGKWGWNADAVRICRYEHKEIWHICLLITSTFFQCPARHQNSLYLCCKDTANQSSWGYGKGKRRPRGLHMLLGYDACISSCPWRVHGKNMRQRMGNRGCFFQGCSTVALADMFPCPKRKGNIRTC